jgi:hypothetical protein
MKAQEGNSNMENELAGWETPTTVTTEQLDEAVEKLITLDKDYEEKKKISNDASAAYETQRSYVLSLLQSTGKTKYHVDGIGTVSMAIKTQVGVPKNPADKKLMLEYFQSLGPELFNHYATVNHMTLNSYVNQELELNPEFVLPGCGEKKETPELRFRKEK